MSSELRVKKLRGSGGYVIAKVTDEDQAKGNLGGPDLFLSPIGRLDPAVILKWYCNTCEGEFESSPSINYESPNEKVADNLVLVEKGQYVCIKCSAVLAEYRTFKKPDENKDPGPAVQNGPQPQPPQAEPAPAQPQAQAEAKQPVSIRPIAGMSVFDENGNMTGTVRDVGVAKDRGIVLLIQAPDGGDAVIGWGRIGKIGEVILLKPHDGTCCAGQSTPAAPATQEPASPSCTKCGFANAAGAKFCEMCGSKV